MRQQVYIGFDPREVDAFAVARSSILRHNKHVNVKGLVLSELRRKGLYYRPTEIRNGRLCDVLSARPDYDGAMSTEFAISRFLVPMLAESGWALFMDADMLVRGNVQRVFDLADRTKAVMVVKHDHNPSEAFKMDGQKQTRYARKNWSSVCLWNVSHPANRRLTVEMVNTLPGRDLHAFSWLEDDEIGELGPEWNYLVNHSDTSVDPMIVHFTDGVPSMAGYEDDEFGDEWRAELMRWAA